MHGEEESLRGQRLFKDHSWRIAEKKLSFGVRKPLKKLSNSTYITTCCLGGLQEKNQEKKMLSPKNNLQHIQLSDTTVTSNRTASMVGSSNQTIIQKQTLKTTQKWVTGHKTKLLLWPFQFPDLHPVENEWGELKRRSTVMELWIWRIWRDSGWRNGFWSLVRCSLTSSGIIGENSYTILANWGFKKYWIKGYR